MKFKDIAALIFLAIVLVIVGSTLINHFGSSKKTRVAQVEVVRVIDPNYNEEAKLILLGKNPKYPVVNFSIPINFTQGFGNSSPFSGQ